MLLSLVFVAFAQEVPAALSIYSAGDPLDACEMVVGPVPEEIRNNGLYRLMANVTGSRLIAPIILGCQSGKVKVLVAHGQHLVLQAIKAEDGGTASVLLPGQVAYFRSAGDVRYGGWSFAGYWERVRRQLVAPGVAQLQADYEYLGTCGRGDTPWRSPSTDPRDTPIQLGYGCP